MGKMFDIERLDKSLEKCMEIFYTFVIILGYNFIRIILKNGIKPEEFYNHFGYYFFIIIFISALLFLIIAEGIKFYIKHSNKKVYYKLRIRFILLFSFLGILFFEALLIR